MQSRGLTATGGTRRGPNATMVASSAANTAPVVTGFSHRSRAMVEAQDVQDVHLQEERGGWGRV